MVKQISIDLEKFRCCSFWSKLPVEIKRSEYFAVNHEVQILNFWKPPQKGALPERNLGIWNSQVRKTELKNWVTDYDVMKPS